MPGVHYGRPSYSIKFQIMHWHVPSHGGWFGPAFVAGVLTVAPLGHNEEKHYHIHQGTHADAWTNLAPVVASLSTDARYLRRDLGTDHGASFFSDFSIDSVRAV